MTDKSKKIKSHHKKVEKETFLNLFCFFIFNFWAEKTNKKILKRCFFVVDGDVTEVLEESLV